MASINTKFLQINLRRAPNAVDNLCLKIRDFSGPFISLITEPAVKLGQTVGLERGINAFSKGKKPRTAIVASKYIRLSLVPEYSGRDVTVCLWHTESQEYPLIYVISLYCDSTFKELPEQIHKFLRDRAQNLICICGSDTNAWSTLWSEPETKPRGAILENLVFQHNVAIANIGDKPTFIGGAGKRSTIIDVTFVSQQVLPRVNDWKVLKEETFLDNKMITFEIDFGPPNVVYGRNYKKAPWGEFKEIIQKELVIDKIPSEWNIITLEEESQKFMAKIVGGLNEVCPKTLRPFKYPAFEWFTEELKEWRRQNRKLHHLLIKSPTMEKNRSIWSREVFILRQKERLNVTPGKSSHQVQPQQPIWPN